MKTRRDVLRGLWLTPVITYSTLPVNGEVSPYGQLRSVEICHDSEGYHYLDFLWDNPGLPFGKPTVTTVTVTHGSREIFSQWAMSSVEEDVIKTTTYIKDKDMEHSIFRRYDATLLIGTFDNLYTVKGEFMYTDIGECSDEEQ